MYKIYLLWSITVFDLIKLRRREIRNTGRKSYWIRHIYTYLVHDLIINGVIGIYNLNSR